MKKKLQLVAFSILLITAVFAQEHEKKEEVALKGTHRLTLVLGHSHLSEGIKENGKKGWKTVPSTGIDYDYWLSNHWAIGVQTDIVIEDFEVEDHDQTVIERSKPLSTVAVAIFKPGEHVSFLAGMGGEFAKEENFALTRLGIETGWEMKNHWEFGISLLYDIKWSAYDTWVFGFGISKLLGRHRK